MPPDHSTAASGTLPTEQTKLSTAMSGPTSTFSIVPDGRAGASVRNSPLKKSVAELRPMKPASRKPMRDLLPEHLPVAAEVVRDVRPRRGRASAARASGRSRAGRVVLVAGRRPARVLARLRLEPGRDEQPQRDRHQRDHHDAAEVLGERELPADQHPQDEPELPDEVRRGELERERASPPRRPSGTATWRSRRRRRSTRRTRRRARSRAPTGRAPPPDERGLDALARDPRLHDGGDREARGRAPTRPPTPSGRRCRGRRRSCRGRRALPATYTP